MTGFLPFRLLLWLCLFFMCGNGLAQGGARKIYHVNYWVSGGIALTGIATNSISHGRLRSKPGMTEEHVRLITARGVNRFDHWALRQDPLKKDAAHEASNYILYPSALLPFFLFLDTEIRHSWLDISLMYAETQAINSNLYGWSPLGPTFIDRYRPAVYYEELPMKERNFGNLRNSFYSGHVGSTATATFFAAKVYADYHPELGGKKLLLYGLAGLPPVMVGYLRIKALKHFPSDVIAGGIIGASLGILIPELHRKTKGRASFSVLYHRERKGLGMAYRF